MGQKKHYSENCIVISAVKFINLLSEDNTGVILTVLILNTTCVEFLMLNSKMKNLKNLKKRFHF